MKLTGARILMECLREQKVDTIFGYPGGTILNVYDALYDYKEITHILTSHEQGAAHAADGYARSTGKVGVCFATSGPGATNLTTGIATAYMDSIPMVAITGQVPSGLLGRDIFQEVDITGIAMPITKATQVERAIQLSGSFMPQRFKSLVDKFGHSPDAMKQAGIVYAAEQMVDLVANGVRGVHVYTMNKPDVAAGIAENLSKVLGRG